MKLFIDRKKLDCRLGSKSNLTDSERIRRNLQRRRFVLRCSKINMKNSLLIIQWSRRSNKEKQLESCWVHFRSARTIRHEKIISTRTNKFSSSRVELRFFNRRSIRFSLFYKKTRPQPNDQKKNQVRTGFDFSLSDFSSRFGKLWVFSPSKDVTEQMWKRKTMKHRISREFRRTSLIRSVAEQIWALIFQRKQRKKKRRDAPLKISESWHKKKNLLTE